MKFISSLVILAAAALSCLAQTMTPVRVTYDNTYDNPNYPLSATACSNGVNGLENKYPTLGTIPNYPFVGGIPGLTWNSTLCGTCWQLTYITPDGTIFGISVFAVDAASTFNVAEEAFTTLAGSAGVAAGGVNATVFQFPC